MRPDSFQQEQQGLLQLVLGAPGGAAPPRWLSAGDAAQAGCLQRGLQAYRANGQALAERALAAAYPVLVQLVGEENFASLARHFWARHPPVCGDMACWGDLLGAFVGASAQLADEPCLADVAHLEWRMHLASSAADVSPDAATFARLATEDPARITLTLGAGVAWLASPYPVASIVNAHLTGSPSLQQAGQWLAEGRAEHVLVWRQGLRPRVRVSTAIEHRLLEMLMAGRSLLDALDNAHLPGDSGAVPFDFNAWLGEAVQTGLVMGVHSLPTTEGNT
ncbi:putative DNA-binding domain-containing protein [Polaromonas sp.]|uniref:HvfC/BufC family peptide modification chaperone n=1 Tax=Polaromonas sp. TaxID=1869339 RepID=UPI0024884D36|nr:putative DNA-binding domain-containing protein [Polaromonas sp.]MDI1272392.1 putative DNA-binding domain-containing protein [Polaromonas sp.]